MPRVPRGEGRARPARGPRPAARRGHRAPAAADRLRVPPGRRARPAARVLRLARRPRLPLDAVRPPPVRAALHARAGHHPRGHRPREHAREPALRRAQAPGRRRGAPRARPTRRCSSSPTSSGSRSSSASSARTASCARTAPGSSPPTARSRSSATWRSARSTSPRWATIEYDITKYQPVLYAADVDGPPLEDVSAGSSRRPTTRRRRATRPRGAERGVGSGCGGRRRTRHERRARRSPFRLSARSVADIRLVARDPPSRSYHGRPPADRSRGHVRRHHAPALDHPDLAALAPRRRRAQRPPLRGQRRAPALGARAAAACGRARPRRRSGR